MFDQILRRCLAPLPEQRYASAAELGYDLARLERAWAKRRAITRMPKVLLGPGVEQEGQPLGTPGNA